MEKTEVSQNRNSKRSLVLIAARLRTQAGPLDVRLRNLSCNGALLESDVPPAIGAKVVFERGDTISPARVAWSSNGRFGIEFDRPIEESEVLIHIGKPRGGADLEAKPYKRTGLRKTPPLNPLERYVGETWFKSLSNPLGE